MEGPPLGPGGEDITWPDHVGPRGRKASSTRKIKPQTSNLTVVTLTTRLSFTFGWLVGDVEWAMGVVRGAHGGEWGDFFHRSGAPIEGAPERLMEAFLTWRGIPLARSLAPLPRRAQRPHVRPPGPGMLGNAAVARMMARGARQHSSSSSNRRTVSITTLPPRSRATAATRATNVRDLARATKPNGAHVLQPVHLHPPRNCQLTTPTAGHQRHADYGRSGTIGGRHATHPPTRSSIQTGGATTPATTPRSHSDPGAPGVTCRDPTNTAAVGT